MLIIEEIKIGDKSFIKTYSDNNKMIEREGVLYAEAIDPIGFDRKYTETDIEIE